MLTETPDERERADLREIPEEVERPPASPLRWLADTYEQAQRLRIQLSNRVSAVERNVDLGPVPRSAALGLLEFGALERSMARDMEAALEGHLAMKWLGEVYGIGPVLATKLLAQVDIHRAQTVSALWRFAGYAVIEGVRERPTKGEHLHYCTRLKTAVYLASSQFLKAGEKSPYRAVYDISRQRYEATRADWTKGHRHLAALRRVSKLFLSHLWQTWREAAGLPIRQPYVMEYLGHIHWLDPWQFVGRADTREAAQAE